MGFLDYLVSSSYNFDLCWKPIWVGVCLIEFDNCFFFFFFVICEMLVILDLQVKMFMILFFHISGSDVKKCLA
ncbi:hypothetical protein HanPI659440_Chr15g0606261 [Helianthus annuus]|nr:hypothetical protein HanPI659440_Chr15g0606261 [Helianthus annuus]